MTAARAKSEMLRAPRAATALTSSSYSGAPRRNVMACVLVFKAIRGRAVAGESFYWKYTGGGGNPYDGRSGLTRAMTLRHVIKFRQH